jgi:anthranilate phosphoribosyltransferase
MRARMIPVESPEGAIDVCGTGGDGHHTLNVSTAVSLVVAACGVPVAKHGNRAASSKAGAADTLEALGLNLANAGERAAETLQDIGIAFLFAQTHHPKLGPIAPIRKALGKRTIFNLMGPLANPAHVQRQLVGIARPAYVPIYAEAFEALGTQRSFIVSGDEGWMNSRWRAAMNALRCRAAPSPCIASRRRMRVCPCIPSLRCAAAMPPTTPMPCAGC